jgi:hypothetical protein
LNVFAPTARGTIETRRVVMNKNAIARFETAHGIADFFDHSDRFMTQHERRFALDVPGHDVAGADAAGARANQDVVGANLGAGAFLDADVAEIVKPGHLHDPSKMWSGAGLVNDGGWFLPDTMLQSQHAAS